MACERSDFARSAISTRLTLSRFGRTAEQVIAGRSELRAELFGHARDAIWLRAKQNPVMRDHYGFARSKCCVGAVRSRLCAKPRGLPCPRAVGLVQVDGGKPARAVQPYGVRLRGDRAVGDQHDGYR